MIEGVKRRYRVCQKRNFIIWSYEDGPIKAEETNPLLKTYTHRCEERSEFALSVIAGMGIGFQQRRKGKRRI
jgi:hypothetical protein